MILVRGKHGVLVGVSDEELVEEVALRAHDLHAVVPAGTNRIPMLISRSAHSII